MYDQQWLRVELHICRNIPICSRANREGEKWKIERNSGIIFTLQSVLRYECLALLAKRSIVVRSHGNSRIVHRTFRIVFSHCVRVQIAPRLNRDRPNVKRNFAARLRAIALSPSDIMICTLKLLLYYPQGVTL